MKRHDLITSLSDYIVGKTIVHFINVINEMSISDTSLRLVEFIVKMFVFVLLYSDDKINPTDLSLQLVLNDGYKPIGL